MQHAKIAGNFFGLALLIFASGAHAASVITVAYEVSKNDSILKNTNIMTFDGEKLRVDYLGTGDKRTKTTPFLLTLDHGKSWVLGNEHKKQYYCANVNMNEFFGDIGDLITKVAAFTAAEFSDSKVEQVLEEAGPTIQGHPTVHVRIQTTAKVKASVIVKTYKFEIKKVDDFWYARDMQMHPARARWIEALTHSGYEHLDKLSQQIRASIKGALLKQETVMQVIDVKKKETDTYGRKIQVTSVKEVNATELLPDTFSKPACQDITKDQIKSVAGGMFDEGNLTL